MFGRYQFLIILSTKLLFYSYFCPRNISQVFAVQHVDVCMFSNGKFKNVVADVYESYQIKAGESYRKEYTLLPVKGKNEHQSTHAHTNYYKK